MKYLRKYQKEGLQPVRQGVYQYFGLRRCNGLDKR